LPDFFGDTMKVNINGIELAYDDNSAGPPIILLHGFPLNRRMWRPQEKALVGAGYRLITPDLRGFGESDAPEGPYTMSAFADDAVGLMDHLAIKQAVVGGMSMGGYVLLNLLERYPERIIAACFITTRSGTDDEGGKARRLALAEEVAKTGSFAVADTFRSVLFATETIRTKPELINEVYSWMKAMDTNGLTGALLAMRERKDYSHILGSFKLPALVIGAEQDRAVPLDTIREFVTGLPNGTLCLIPDAGHMVNMEQPEAFNSCLLDFLRKIHP
jgi:3-oxoadipate enol-lactonase